MYFSCIQSNLGMVPRQAYNIDPFYLFAGACSERVVQDSVVVWLFDSELKGTVFDPHSPQSWGILVLRCPKLTPNNCSVTTFK